MSLFILVSNVRHRCITENEYLMKDLKVPGVLLRVELKNS